MSQDGAPSTAAPTIPPLNKEQVLGNLTRLYRQIYAFLDVDIERVNTSDQFLSTSLTSLDQFVTRVQEAGMIPPLDDMLNTHPSPLGLSSHLLDPDNIKSISQVAEIYYAKQCRVTKLQKKIESHLAHADIEPPSLPPDMMNPEDLTVLSKITVDAQRKYIEDAICKRNAEIGCEIDKIVASANKDQQSLFAVIQSAYGGLNPPTTHDMQWQWDNQLAKIKIKFAINEVKHSDEKEKQTKANHPNPRKRPAEHRVPLNPRNPNHRPPSVGPRASGEQITFAYPPPPPRNDNPHYNSQNRDYQPRDYSEREYHPRSQSGYPPQHSDSSQYHRQSNRDGYYDDQYPDYRSGYSPRSQHPRDDYYQSSSRHTPSPHHRHQSREYSPRHNSYGGSSPSGRGNGPNPAYPHYHHGNSSTGTVPPPPSYPRQPHLPASSSNQGKATNPSSMDQAEN